MEETKKRWNKGGLLYDSFCGMFKGFVVATPRTNTLELFALLKERKEHELLVIQMMKEFLSNFDDVTPLVHKGELYKNVVYRESL